MLTRARLFFHKLTHWEYWPFAVVQTPMFFSWLWYAAKARSLFFFNAANPLIKNGGFLMESKKEIYDLLPAGFYPATVKLNTGCSIETALAAMRQAQITFPAIAKPDIGLRGMAVQKVDTAAELQTYIQKIKVDFLIQSYIDLPNEAGIFFVRLPGEAAGHITGIVAKELLSITGNGQQTMRQLVEQNPRYHLQLTALEKMYGAQLERIPAAGEYMNLVPYGNHSRGALFADASHLITEQLTQTINDICLQIPHFYFGRLDIRYNSFEALAQGRDFSIIELNGAGSDPAHIYDPKHSIFFAWREIMKHHKLLYTISKQNHRKGYRYLTLKEGRQMFCDNSRHLALLKAFGE
jgi:hypothetical protein